MFSMAMWMAALVAPIQIVVGDLHGLNTLEHQPQKVMAMEGHFESYPNGAPLILIGSPDSEEEAVHAALGLHNLSSPKERAAGNECGGPCRPRWLPHT